MQGRKLGLATAIGVCLMTATATVAKNSATETPAVIDWPVPIVGPGPITQAVVPFGGGLVGVGQEQDGVTTRATAWWSADGSAWEQTMLDGPTGGYSAIQQVAALPTGLVAMGPHGVERCAGEGEGAVRCEPLPVAVWRSADGRAWGAADVSATLGRGSIVGLAAGPRGLLAVGVDQDGVATTWRSSDGAAWEAASLVGTGFARARVGDVAATHDGWVMVGSTGAKDTPAGGVATANGSAGAAWTSQDGMTWQPADVEGIGEQVELHSVYVGSDGLTAVGTLDGSRHADIWSSPDGTTWTLLPPGPEDVSRPLPETSDGQWIIGSSWLSEDDGGSPGGIGWWVSADGTTWAALASEGQVATSPRWDGGVTPDVIDLVDGTLVVIGWSDQELLWLAPLDPRPV